MKKILANSGMLFTMLMLFGIGFSGCKDKNDDNNNIQTPSVTQQDRAFVSDASATNFTELQFGNLAVQKTTSDSVKSFAQMMVSDHTAGKQQLDSIASSLNVQRRDSMDDTHATLYAAMLNLGGYPFDSAYVHNQVLDHQAAQTLMQDEVDKGGNAMLVDYARKQLPVISNHLKRITAIRDSMFSNNTNPMVQP
jgi:putative membrane protein